MQKRNENKASTVRTFLMKKEHLPSKMCPVCNRPFNWRKKWRNCWDEVKYCSERCRRIRVNHPSRVTHTHTVHTGCTDCTQEQVLSQVRFCRQLTVQTVQYFRFFSGKLSTKPLTQNDTTSYKRTETEK